MHAEVISIGDELTSGQRLDTNSQWISQQLGDLGVRVLYHTTVADDLAANVRVFQTAIERADLVVATGGLGPTADDLTREALAQAIGVELTLDAAALAAIEALFSRRKRPMPQRNRVQAMFPAGSRVIANPEGTAPGIDVNVPRTGRSACRVFALPGVPVEMREMWRATVAPAIAAMFALPRVVRHRRIKCFGVGESDLEAMLPDLIRRGRTPQVGITVHGATITLRITAEGESVDDCCAVMEPTVATIRQCLGNLVFGEEDDELEHAVGRLLLERGETVGTCEWGSGGLLAHWLSNVPDSERFFRGGTVLGDPFSLKVTAAVGVRQTGILPKTPGEQVEALAQTARDLYRADYGLAADQAPDYSAEVENPPVVWAALASAAQVVTKSSPHVGHPDILRTRAAKQALNLLRLTLLEAR